MNALKDVAETWCPPQVVSSTVHLLEGLSDWVLKRQPDIVMMAAGILDTRRLCFGEDERLVPLKGFERNVRCAIRLVRERSTAIPVWATIAPVDRRRVASLPLEERDFGYDNDTISLYNEEAKAVVEKMRAETLDLYGHVKAASRVDSIRPTGIRFDERGSDYIAAKVAAKLRGLCG